MRNWQEQGFRDLKSAGWQLEMCRLRSVEDWHDSWDPRARDRFGSVAWRPRDIKGRKLIKTEVGTLRRAISLFRD